MSVRAAATLIRGAFLVMLLAASLPAVAGEAPAEQPSVRDDQDVIEASEKWLKLLDDGKLGPAYDLGAKPLHDAVTRAGWIKGVGDARKPLGKLKSRSREKFARAHSMPNGPEGDYAIIEFHSTFANGKRAVEQVIWMLEPEGGIWKVSGYYIR
jgi:hypothetical protein